MCTRGFIRRRGGQARRSRKAAQTPNIMKNQKKRPRTPSVLKDSFVRHSPHSVVSKCALVNKNRLTIKRQSRIRMFLTLENPPKRIFLFGGLFLLDKLKFNVVRFSTYRRGCFVLPYNLAAFLPELLLFCQAEILLSTI